MTVFLKETKFTNVKIIMIHAAIIKKMDCLWISEYAFWTNASQVGYEFEMKCKQR